MSDVFQQQVAVATTPTQLVAPTPGSQTVIAKNRGASAIFVGGPAVKTNTGVEVKAGEDLAQGGLQLPAETELYGIVASGTVRMDVLSIEAD